MDLSQYTVKELRDLARSNNLRGYSRLRKQELIQKIQKEVSILEDADNPNLDTYTLQGLKALARMQNIKGVSRMRKKQLIRVLQQSMRSKTKNIPKKIAGYTIQSVLGSGTFGVTYLATKGGQRYSIKEFRRPPKIERLKQEVLALKQVQPCQNVPKYKSIYRNNKNGKVYLITYYVEGIPMKQYIQDVRKGIYPQTTAKDINVLLLQLTSTLWCIHQHGYIHRNIKGNNIVVDPVPSPPKATWIDFGLSCFYDQSRRGVDCTTQKGGNRQYYPKEAFQKPLEKEMYPYLDVFALGLLFLFSTTGKRYTPTSIPQPVETGSRKMDTLIEAMTVSSPQEQISLRNVVRLLQNLSDQETYSILSR
jgi:serine/threonine protein kinase